MAVESSQLGHDGRPADSSYLESGLPDDLQESIRRFCSAEDATYREMYSYEVYSGINSALSCGEISDRCAQYLRKRYLYR